MPRIRRRDPRDFSDSRARACGVLAALAHSRETICHTRSALAQSRRLGQHRAVAVSQTILDAIGRTPLVRLARVGRGLAAELYGKVESCNPGGSAKDRLALHLVDMAEKRGLLKPGGTIVEASAGNTGVGLAMVAAVRGYRCVVVVPHETSADKLAVVRALGAEVYECRASEDYVDVAERLARERRAFRP